MNDRSTNPAGELLLAVERPSRYIGGEVNARRKEAAEGRLHFALAFPDAYEVAMSHLGLQILYNILNDRPGVRCERCYAPWTDMERELRRRRLPLSSLESQRPLAAFDIVGFSLQYELSYTNVLLMLDLGGIPLRSDERGEGQPLVIAGGPAAFNPAPMSPFIDAFVIGEGEEAITEVTDAVAAVRGQGGGRAEQLAALAAIRGVYVPAIHTAGERIAKRIITDLDRWRQPLCPVVPLMQTVHDRVTLEIARGCTRGCRFCQAGMVWRPVRERSPAVLEEMAETMLAATGHDELSLLSLSSGDHSRIEPLLVTLMDRYYARRIALALPSLRAETLTPRLIDAIRRVRKTSFTLAPEAGTERLRRAINKGNSEEELLATTERVFAAGWKAVKLYFMLGLPGERDPEDLEGIAEMAHRVLRTARNRGQVTVSLSTFVPKPHTPFQWQRQIGVDETIARQEFFKRRLRHRSISVKWHDARMSLLEGIFSRGGEETARLVERAYRLGCRFDGWSDRFRFDLWQQALEETGIDPAAALAERPLSAPLPWERIDCGLSRDFLLAEAKRAETGEPTPDCRTGPCSGCGVCGAGTADGGIVAPVLASAAAPAAPFVSAFAGSRPGGGAERSYRLRLAKQGTARFLSHLELSQALARAVVLGGLFFVYSQGFHPHPRLSFAGATAVGMESDGEFADIRILDPAADPAAIAGRINTGLPDGVRVTAIRELLPHDPSLSQLVRGFSYELLLPEPPDAETRGRWDACVRRFLDAESFPVLRESDKKSVRKDIRPLVTSLSLADAPPRILLSASFGPEGTVRPSELLGPLFGLSAEAIRAVRIVKRATLLSPLAGECDRRLFGG